MELTIETKVPLFRRMTPILLAGALCVLSAVTFVQVMRTQQQQADTVRREVTSRVSNSLSDFEHDLLDDLRQYSEEFTSDPRGVSQRLTRAKRRVPWLDTAYVWDPQVNMEGPRNVYKAGRFWFPPPSPTLPMNTSRFCIIKARFHSTVASPQVRAQHYIRECANEQLSVQLFAASEAANVLSSHGEFQDALRVLDTFDDGRPLSAFLDEQDALNFMVVLRMQRADLLKRMNQEDAALQLYISVGQQITELPVTLCEANLPVLDIKILPVLAENEQMDVLERLREQYDRAMRRVDAYHEIQSKLFIIDEGERSAPAAGFKPFLYNQLSSDPWVLYYPPPQPTQNPLQHDTRVAVQLDPSQLIHAFLRRPDMRDFREWLVVMDSSGRQLGGATTGGPIQLKVPFTETLTYLNVGVRSGMLVAFAKKLNFNTWLYPLFVTAICLALGMFALVTQIQANNEQKALLRRQRDFATRVTHELKTPLAGIKVMAENVELGTFQTDAQRQQMAQAIIAEADRLTERVNEILAVTRTRQIPNPTPFDPEEPIMLAVEAWAPRLAQVGIRFEVDLEPTEHIRGDAGAYQDAVSCLLDNALKYRDEAADECLVRLELIQTGRNISCHVTDNGIGVPATLRKQIFERFVRVEGDNRGRAGGHGLGLSQVKEIMTAHGGTATCTDGIETGTRFTLTAPSHG